MRIGLIGDVHAEDQLLSVALSELRHSGVEKILCVGDLADGPGDVNRCIDLLEAHGVPTVSGNHDQWLLEDRMRELKDATPTEALTAQSRHYLTQLPPTLEVETPHGLLLLCHGMGKNNMQRMNQDDFDFPYTLANIPELQNILSARRYDFVVSGHSHRHWLRTHAGVTFVNAGTLKQEHQPGYVVLDTGLRSMDWISLEN